jgi:hypothetical protein
MNRFVEDTPSIDVGHLKRVGLFPEVGSATIHLTLDGRDYRLEHTVGDPHFTIHFPRSQKRAPQRVRLQTADLTFGGRRYFECPKTAEPVRKLYLQDGWFASRIGHGLRHLTRSSRKEDIQRGRTIHMAARITGADGKGPARGENRTRRLKTLLKEGDPQWFDAATQLAVHRAALKDARGNKPKKVPIRWGDERRDRTSTKWALQHSSDTPESDVLETLGRFLSFRGEDLNPELTDTGEEPWRDRPRLDIRTLNAAGFLQLGKLRVSAVRWDRMLMGYVNSCFMAADLRDLNLPRLVIWLHTDEKAYAQFIDLVWTDDRWYMICPYTERLTTTLYLCCGILASLRAHNQIHRGY